MIKNHSSKPPTHISHLQIQHHSHSETSFYTGIFTEKLILFVFLFTNKRSFSKYNIYYLNCERSPSLSVSTLYRKMCMYSV